MRSMRSFWGVAVVLIIAVLSTLFFIVVRSQKRAVLFLSAGSLAGHEAVRHSFLEAVRSSGTRRLEVNSVSISNPADGVSTAAICEKVLALPAECIVVVGRTIAQNLVSLARKRGCSTPIVMIGVQDPVELGLVESLERPGGVATGVITVSFEDSVPARLLYTTFPHIKSVLLPFYFPQDAAKEITNKAKNAKEYLESKGVKVIVLPIDSFSESMRRVESFLEGHDMLMTVEGDGLNDTQAAGLAKLARQYGVGYFGGLMSALEEGAVLVYATALRYLAEAALSQVTQILYQNKSPSVMPILFLDSTRELVVNQKRAAELGLMVNLDEINAKINADPALESVRGRVRIQP
ncbi:MAG: putative tryptophan/tyrosine transport system substrate-binding protein [Candidatus Dependentiae bacterium]|nr:putative tryptophan/tyrosine transport system substrate-binding protein [Candidatus Dependentiae bacterium]